jgi:hypothetical protein
VRDIGFAVLLALPTAALLRPAASSHYRPAVTQHLQLVVADGSALRQRFSLSG